MPGLRFRVRSASFEGIKRPKGLICIFDFPPTEALPSPSPPPPVSLHPCSQPLARSLPPLDSDLPARRPFSSCPHVPSSPRPLVPFPACFGSKYLLRPFYLHDCVTAAADGFPVAGSPTVVAVLGGGPGGRQAGVEPVSGLGSASLEEETPELSLSLSLCASAG